MDEQETMSVRQEQSREACVIVQKGTAWREMRDKHIAYIGFILLMAGLAALGGAIETGGSILSAAAMIMDGTAFLWICRMEGDGGEKRVRRHNMGKIIMRLRPETQKAFETIHPDLSFQDNLEKDGLTENESTYEKNGAFRRYVDRYSANRGIPKEEALRHELVTQARKYYEEEQDGAFMDCRESH